MNYDNIYKAIGKTRYSGYVTMEYLPVGDQHASLKKAVADMKLVMSSYQERKLAFSEDVFVLRISKGKGLGGKLPPKLFGGKFHLSLRRFERKPGFQAGNHGQVMVVVGAIGIQLNRKPDVGWRV
jgi:hypothetical protein